MEGWVFAEVTAVGNFVTLGTRRVVTFDSNAQRLDVSRRRPASAMFESIASPCARASRSFRARAISSGMLDIKDDVCKTDELHGRVYGVRAREQQRSERGRMHGGKT